MVIRFRKNASGWITRRISARAAVVLLRTAFIPARQTLTKHYGPICMYQRPAVQVQPDGAGKDALLECATFSHKIVNGVTVRDGRYALCNNGTFVEIFRNVVTRCSNQFHATLVCGMIRARTGESRKKGMVDIDNAIGKGLGHQRAQDLHVAGENDQVDFILPKQFDLFFPPAPPWFPS